MKKIMIFYALISEEKNKLLKLNGPFVHYRIDDDGNNHYFFDYPSFMNEKKYLSKYLRERNPSKIPIFHFINFERYETDSRCSACGNITRVMIDVRNYQCGVCSAKVDVSLNPSFDSLSRRAMSEAEDYFENKFDVMKQNYAICMRKK